MEEHPHKAGFVTIVGFPNSGKSTLVNALVGEKLSIVTNKPQTTRHRIFSIFNDADHQIIFTDTPGFVKETGYELHDRMNGFIAGSLEGADLILLVIDLTAKQNWSDDFVQGIKKSLAPVFLVLNKVDLSDPHGVREALDYWNARMDFDKVFSVSALEKAGLEGLRSEIWKAIPDHPPYYPKDELSDRPLRFFISEMIREKIFLLYREEIPYSSEVVVTEYQDDVSIVRMHADIIVERPTQKSIIIGKRGSGIKQLGIESRMDIEAFLGKKIFLELLVKVKEKWRTDESFLDRMGYHP